MSVMRVVLITAGLAAVVGYYNSKGPSWTSPQPAPTPIVWHTSDEQKLVLKDGWSWRLGGFGTVLILSGKVANVTNINKKDPLITCTTYGASGTQISSVSRPLFVSVKADSMTSFRDFSMGFVNSQSSTARCSVTG
jgi:hypothetical protein